MKDDAKKLVLIDGNALIHRAYHALPPLTTKEGEIVNAVYGFTSVLLKVLSEIDPKYIVATFDLAAPTFRHEQYKEYKATRVKAPDELYAQIDRVKEMVRAFNIPIFEKEGFEADDVIGTIVEQSEKSNQKVENIVVTGDLDALQLISKKTKVYALRRGMSDTTIYDDKAVMSRYKLKPDQLIDYKGLRGDPSDNIPGVKGIGEKTASDLLQKYQSLEEVYKKLHEIKPAIREKLERDKMQAFMSQELATIKRDVPLKFDWEGARTQDFDKKKIVQLFQELNFFSLIKRIPGNGQEEAKEISTGVKDFKYELATSKNISEFVREIQSVQEISFVLKTSGIGWDDRKIDGISISWKAGRAIYLEWKKNLLEKINPLLQKKEIKKVGYAVKRDLEFLKQAKNNIDKTDFDIQLAAYVLNPGSKNDLLDLVLEYLGEEIIEEKSKKGQLSLEVESLPEVAQRFCQKADYVLKLKNILEEKINNISQEQTNEKNVRTVFSQIEMPVVSILAQMEIEGALINTKIFEGISKTITKKIERLEKNIYDLSQTEFNINSPKQLAEVLFEKMKLPSEDIKKNKTGFSTASKELNKLRKKHKIIAKIEEYRELFKLKTTYVDTLPELIDKNSRIHTSFNQAITATGRLSSSEPNLQNIPIKTELGQLLRTAFEAPSKWKLVSADYSQIDLRVVAHVSRDRKMIETFHNNKDIHKATAAEINNVTLSQVTEVMRRKAKALNFGIIYGMSVFGFSESADISREEAKNFINQYMMRFQGVAQYMREMKEKAKKDGFVETLLGRRRYIPEINSPNFQVSQAAERMAINMPIQGLAADIMKLSMIAAQKIVEEFPNQVRMILQVHDELIFEVKESVTEDFAKKIKQAMEQVYQLRVPLVVDIKIGDNWGEL